MHKNKYKKINLKHNDDEIIYINNAKHIPKYDLNKAEAIFNSNLKIFLEKNNTLNEKYYKCDYLIFILQDFFWHYCYNLSKYQNIFKKYGKRINIIDRKDYFLVAGYKRILNFLNCYKRPYRHFLIEIRLKITFLYFILKNVVKSNKNKILISQELLKFEYVKKIISRCNLYDCVFPELSNFNYRTISNDVNDALLKNINLKIKNIFFWKLFIFFLKPKKVITLDNLFDNQALLYLCNKKSIEVVGITHGVTSIYHKGLFGTKLVKNYFFKFNKIYVWSKEYYDVLAQKGFIYQKNQINICGWLNKTYSKSKNLAQNYVLYPYEHLADFNNIKKIISYFVGRNYKLVVKKRSGINNYQYLKRFDPLFVDDFTQYQIDRSLCFIASATSLLFDFQFTGKPIVIPNNKNFNLYKFINLINVEIFDDDIESRIFETNYLPKLIPKINNKFVNEFKNI